MKADVVHKRPYWSPRQIMELFGIGKTKAYQLIGELEFGPVINVGGLRVRRAGIVDFIRRREAEMAEELDQRLA